MSAAVGNLRRLEREAPITFGAVCRLIARQTGVSEPDLSPGLSSIVASLQRLQAIRPISVAAVAEYINRQLAAYDQPESA